MNQNLKINKPNFVHLRAHSDYSIIDGLAKITTLVKKAVSLGMSALAITDFTNLFGIIKFYQEARSVGIKPLIGVDFHLQDEFLSYKEIQITALAMNNIGYKNLILLISRAYKQKYDTSGPWINRMWLAELNQGILLLSNGRMGDIGKSLLCNNMMLLNKYLKFYNQYFPDRFYLELIRTGRPDEERYVHSAVALAQTHDLPVVATNDIRFINKDDFDAHEIRVAIHKGFTLNDPKRPKNYSSQQYMRSEKEMCELFSDIPEALKNSVEIAKRCNVVICLGKHFLPQFPTGNMSTEDFLNIQAKKGLEERLALLHNKQKNKNLYQRYQTRLNTELQVINKMGFSGYFLIVMEFIQWSKNHGIPVGPGRGSGAGSLVAYSLKITDLDPLEFNLIFERFLNQERISMPDFDIDFCMEKRDRVIEHVTEMYGQDSVSQIITFGTMAAKGAIRDVGRVLGYPYNFLNHLSKMIPSDPGITIKKAFEIEPKLLEIYHSDKEVKVLINMALKLEGTIRNIGTHAGGIVISPTKITDFSPIYCDEKGEHSITQFDKEDVENVGLVKFDFLGLRTLTIINLTIQMINDQRKKNHDDLFDINSISLDDEKAFKLLQRAETTAVFQLESHGMKDLIKRLQPDSFEDIIALVALFRPGPLQSGMVDNFINRKHGYEKIAYPDALCQHECLKSVLKSTYGIILYQEQVMQIAQVLSGYTLGSADILRHAMSKKQSDEMIKQRLFFEEGAKKNGINSVLAMKIFDLVEKFSSYGFNKSHSAAYALISYQTLWLKAHYPEEFMASVMTADMDNTERLSGLVDECWRMGIKILPPDINSSLDYFYVNQNKEIVYGIGAIKGIGKNLIKDIIQERDSKGNFFELFEFCIRVGAKKLNLRVLEKLIMAGALDAINSDRAQLMHTLKNTLKAAEQYSKYSAIGQSDLFGPLKEKLEECKKFGKQRCQLFPEFNVLHGEREALGLYLTGHPIDQYLQEIDFCIKHYQLTKTYLKEFNRVTTIAGIVITTQISTDKQGNRIGICTLDSRFGRTEVKFFSDILNIYQKFLEKDRILIITGSIIINPSFEGKVKINAKKVIDIDEARKKHVRKLILSLQDEQINDMFLNQLHQLLESYRSEFQQFRTIPVYLHHHKTHEHVISHYEKTGFVVPHEKLINNLRSFIGSQQVKLVFN